VNALGYNHPVIVNAIAEQSKKLIHTSTSTTTRTAELALRLTERTGMDRAFFANTARKRGRRLKLAPLMRACCAKKQEHWDEVSGSRSELPRADVWRHVHDLQGQVPRAFGPVVPAWSL